MRTSGIMGPGGGVSKIILYIFGLMILTEAVSAARRHDRLLPARPTPEALKEIAESMGAARFEELTVDAIADSSRPIAKILNTANPDTDVEYLNYQGVMGRPGIDFPVLPSIPHTEFSCKKVATGYYADLETDCQVFHICDGGRKISFLCPNGTIFRQSHLICDWWFKVDCNDSPGQYEESAEHLAEDQRKRDRSNKQQTANKNFDTILTSQQRPSRNQLSQNSNEYKAEASFTSIAQSGAPSRNENQQRNQSTERKSPPRRSQASRQDKSTNSRQYSSFEFSSREVEQDNDDSQKKNNDNAYKFSTTRRATTDYTDAATYRASTPPSRNSKETQVAAESASFASNRGRNNYFQYSTVFDNRVRSTAEPVYSASVTSPKTTRPTYSTTYIPGSKNYVEVTRSVSQSTSTSRPTTVSQTYSSSIKTTPNVPQSTFSQDVSYSFVNYNQSPTTPAPHYYFTSTANNSAARKGKGFSNSQNTEKPAPQNKSNRNSYPLLDKSKNQNFYAPTVPTVTPKPAAATRSVSTLDLLRSAVYNDAPPTTTTSAPTTYASYVTMPTVSEHAIDMIKTLGELDLVEPTTETEKFLGKRPGLVVPPSAGPNTLHSLAIYFATAVDSLVTTPEPTVATDEIQIEDVTEIETPLEETKESLTALLSKNTLEKYTDLFKNSTNEDIEEVEEEVRNDLEVQQSRGPISSSPQIRELAQVFTHALSAYLQDPETFRKVLSEIRPTDPTIVPDAPTSPTVLIEETTPHNEYASVTKEDDEVLDFSDVSKISTKVTMRPTSTVYESNTFATKTEDDLNIFNRIQTTASYQEESNQGLNKDRTPGSRFITQGVIEDEDVGSNRRGKELLTTVLPQTNNPIAEEINGGLTVNSNNKIPQSFTIEANPTNSTDGFDADTSYFPIPSDGEQLPRYGGFQNNSSPYGEGVQLGNSTPITNTFTNADQDGEAIPLSWGEVISTKESNIPINPSEPAFDLVPPVNIQQNNKLDSVEMSVLNSFVPEDLNNLATVNKTADFGHTTETPTTYIGSTTKYPSYSTDIYKNDQTTYNDNDEQLQRAHSQSFVSSNNQLNRRGKRIKDQSKMNENVNVDEKSANNDTVTVRTSGGLILSLPTLKDILSKPTSLSYTAETHPIVVATEATSTAFDETTISTLNGEETTVHSEPTTNDFTKTSPKPQSVGSTSNYNIWSTSDALGHIWQTTVFLDPMTINDGLTGDISDETIQPSANTYFGRGVTTQVWNNPRTTYDPTTAATEHTETSQYSTYTTPFSTIKAEEYTTASPEDFTTVESKKLPSHSILLDNNEYFDQFKNHYQESESKERVGKSLTSIVAAQNLEKLNSSDIDQTMMSKAKEMFGGLNATSADTLMNVMKQADKNTTVRRLILLLIQTCDDDHNKTLEASRTALLDALIRLPVGEVGATDYQKAFKDSLEITGQYDLQKTTKNGQNSFGFRRSDEIIETDDTKRPELPTLSERRGKSYEDLPISSTTAEYVSSTSKATTTTTTTRTTTTTTTTTPEPPTSTSVKINTSQAPVITIKMGRRGNRKFIVKSTKTAINPKSSFDGESYSSVEKGNTVSLEEHSVPSDTRALELLRSLYSLAARWG